MRIKSRGSAKSSQSEIGECENIEDKLSESNLYQEVSELKIDVGRLNMELTDIMRTKLTELEHLVKASLPALISKEVSAVMKEKMSVLEESYQWAQKQGRCITPNIRQTNQEILHAIGSLKTSL